MMDEYNLDIENVDSLLSETGDDVFSSIIEHTGETVIFDTDNINDSDVDEERIFRFTNNYTGYEIGCNEFRFHVFRENEGFWIDNFNEIKCPFLCEKG